MDEGGIDPLMRGMFMSPAKKKMPHQNLNNQLTEHLFTSFHAVALDLASMNVQRSRDHGIPFYNEYRKHCGLKGAETFDDLKDEITDPDVRRKLQDLYGHPGWPIPDDVRTKYSEYFITKFIQALLVRGKAKTLLLS